MTEETKKTKTRLPSNLLRKILCKLSLHNWASIHTKYGLGDSEGVPYKIAWRQYCLYCPVERENSIHVR